MKTHYKKPNFTYTACGIVTPYTTENVDDVDCGNCRYTEMFIDAKFNKDRTPPTKEDWKRTTPEAGAYWVSDGCDVDTAYSDGIDWYTSSCHNYDFDAFEIIFFKELDIPTTPRS